MVHAILNRLWPLLLLPSLCWGSGIYNPGSTGAGGGSGIVSPGTFTWTNGFGITGLPSGTTTSAATTFGQNQLTLAQNLLANGGFEIWRFGTSIPYANAATNQQIADGWVFSSATRDDNLLTVSKETSIVHDGNASLKMLAAPTFNTGDSTTITQTILNPWDYSSSSITLSIWINTTVSGTLRLNDRLSNTDVNYSGTGAWQKLSMTKFVASSNTQLSLLIMAALSAGSTIYVDSAMLVRGDTVFDWIPRPISSEIATATSDGGDLTKGDKIGVGNTTTAAAGDVGELVESTNSGTITGPTTLTSIILTAGDWMVLGNVSTDGPGTYTRVAISLNNNSITGCVEGYSMGDGAVATGQWGGATAIRQLQLSSTTTVYLVVSNSGSQFSLGSISARRMR